VNASPNLPPSPSSSVRPRWSRFLFSVAVVAALAAALANGWYKYGVFLELTRAREGNLWPDGRPVALDFIQFAAVSEAWKRGRIDQLYSSTGTQHELMELSAELPCTFGHLLTFNYPPFFTWLLRPLAPFDYLQRFVGWTLIQCAFAAGALACWRSELDRRSFVVVAIAWVLSPSVVTELTIGQCSFVALASISGTLCLLNRGRDFVAGLALSVLLYKPTLGIVLGPLLVTAGRWRLVLGVATGALLLGIASLAVSLKACKDYPNIARELWIMATSHPDFFARHFNLLGFVTTVSSRTPEEFNWVRRAFVVVPSVLLLLGTARAWCNPWRPGTMSWDAGAAATVLTTLVATPYLYAYDTVLLGVAVVYSVKTWDARPEWHRWFILTCVTIAECFVAGGLSLLDWMREHWHTRLQLAPIALTAWAVLEIRWANAAKRLTAEEAA